MRTLWLACAALVLVASLAASESVLARDGELATGDAVLEDGSFVDWVRQNLTAGTRYLIRASSNDIDTSLVLRFADGTALTDADFDGTDPAIVYTAVRSETVEIGVSGASEGVQGPYSLAVDTIQPARSLQVGQKSTRTLGTDSAVSAGEDTTWMIDSYLLTGSRGDRVTFRLASSDFDAYLRIQSRDGLVEENDDSHDTRDSEIVYVFAQRGQLEVVARGADPADSGEYSLTAQRDGTATSVDIGHALDASLAEGSADYLLDGRRGQAVSVSVESEDFDPALDIVDRLGRRSSNDDYGDGTNAKLHYVFTEDGTVTLSVKRFEAGDSGTYHLSVDPVAFRPLDYVMKGRALTDGASIDGYLDATALRRDTKYAHRYTFTAAAYEMVSVQLSSDDLDSYLELKGPEGYEVSDDDSGGGYNAQLRTVCPTGGEYTVYATTAGDFATGFYNLTFSRGGTLEPALDASSRLEPRTGRDISGRHFETYTVKVTEGQTLDVFMSAEDFDAFLYVWSPEGTDITKDDDSGGGTNARVTVNPAAEGTWIIYATSSDDSATGAYRLRALVY